LKWNATLPRLGDVLRSPNSISEIVITATNSMTNPYSPPDSTTLSSHSASVHPAHQKGRWVALAVSILLIILFCLLAGIMIPQAIRIGSEISQLPPRFQGSDGLRSAAQGSWICGITAILGLVINIIAILLVRRGKLALPIGLAIMSIVAIAIIAVAFKPV
jgi:hypothetical protein